MRRLVAGLVLVAVVACDRAAPVTSPTSAPPTTSAPSRTATPAPTPAATTVIGVLGDFGVSGKRPEQVVALMGRWAPLDAVVTTGDNAYSHGTTEQAARSRAILAPLLRDGTPLYAALGNHDVATRNGAPVMRALGMPARWYTAVVGDVELVVLDSNRTSDAAQLAFLRRALGPRRTAFRVVAFHHPAAACSFHEPDAGVRRHWVPLFGTNVDLVLAGHNHTYERFAAPGGVPWVTTGGGGATLYPSLPGTCHGPAKVQHIRTAHHAVRLTATSDRLAVEAVGLDGTVFDSVSVARR